MTINNNKERYKKEERRMQNLKQVTTTVGGLANENKQNDRIRISITQNPMGSGGSIDNKKGGKKANKKEEWKYIFIFLAKQKVAEELTSVLVKIIGQS